MNQKLVPSFKIIEREICIINFVKNDDTNKIFKKETFEGMNISLKEFIENENLDKTKVVKLNWLNSQLKELPDLSSLVNLTHLSCFNNQLKELPDLSSLVNLTHLNCSYNKLTKLPDLSSLVNLTHLICDNNQLLELPDLSSLVNLKYLKCCYNKLTKLPDLSSLVNLKYLYFIKNQITIIPQSIIYCTRLEEFACYDNPIDYVPPNIERFFDRMDNIGNIYNDSQSVHRSSVTNSVKKSIENLMDDKTNLSSEKMITIILENDILTQEIKSRIIQYIENKEELIHSMVTFEDLITKVVSRIISHRERNELFKILNEQMIESECMCLTGRMSRLVSVLDGFFEDIRIGISCSEMISSIILQVTSIPGTVEEHKELSTKKLLENGFKLEEIESWIEAIE
jgi:hypothetical protein